MRHWSRVALVGLALAAAACSDDDSGAEPPRTTSTTRPSETTTTSPTTGSTTTTTTQAVGPAEWVAIVQDVYNRRHELRLHPDPAAVVTVMHPDCSCYSNEFSTVEFLASEGLRYESSPNEVLSVATTGELAEARITYLQVEIKPFPVRLYNADGSLFQETQAPPPDTVNLALSPSGPNGEWRIHDLVSLGTGG